MSGRIRHTFELASPHFVRAILGISVESKGPDPFVDVCLSPLPPTRGESVIRSIPVGELIDLHAGAVIRDNVVAEDHLLRRYSLNVTFGSEDKVWGRDKLDRVAVQQGDVRQPTQFLQVAEENGRTVYISMAEIFRFYYLSSSVLARSLLSDAILTPEQTIYAPKHTVQPDEHGAAFLVLRRGMNKNDLLTIARLVLSPQRIGLERAKGIYLFKRDKRSGSILRLAARPPFDGQTQLECRGIPLSNDSTSPLLITRIDSCSAELPFNNLRWRYEDDYETQESNGQSKEPGMPGKPRGRKIGIGSQGFVFLDENEQPTTSFVSQLVEVEQFADRFPAVASLKIHREKLEAPQSGRAKARANVHDDPLNLSARKASGTADAKRKTQAVDPMSKHDVDGEPEDTGEKTKKCRLDVLEHSIELAKKIAAISEAKLIDRVVTDKSATAFGHYFNLLPAEVDGRPRRWLYLDDERKLRRPMLILEFERGDRYGYLIDIVRRGDESMSLMLLRTSSGAKATNDQLLEFVRQTASARVRDCPTSVSAMSIHGMELTHKPHRASEKLEPRAIEYCQILAI